MKNSETPEKKNLLIELAKRKASGQAKGNRFGILGKDLSSRFSKSDSSQAYTWRGGRNGSGKP